MRLLAILLLCFALFPSAYAQESSYDEALVAYRADRLKESSRTLKQILKKDPGSRRAAMLLAAVYYQYQSQKLAMKYFELGDDSELTKDTAFAWGSTYLAANEFKKAAKGFRYAIKSKAGSRPYARYYLGVCYYEMGQMARARRQFEKAKSDKLPASIRLKRQRYIKEIRSQQEKLALAFGPRESLQDSGSRDYSEGGEPSTLPLGESLRVQFRPSLSLKQTSSAADNNDLAGDEADVLSHRAVAAWFFGKGPDGNSFGSMDLGLGLTGYQATTNQTQLFTLVGSTGVFVSQKEEARSENSLYFESRPRLNFSLGPLASVETGFAYTAYLPEGKTADAWGQSAASIGIAVETPAVNITVEVNLQQPFDESLDEKANDGLFKADAAVDLGEVGISAGIFQWTTDDSAFLSPDRFRFSFAESPLRYRVGFNSEVGFDAGLNYGLDESSLSLKLENRKRTTSDGQLLTRRSSLDPIDVTAGEVQKVIATASIPLWDSLTLVLRGARSTLKDYRFAGSDPDDATQTKDITTAVDQTEYTAGAVISLMDWIRVSGTYTSTFNIYKNSAATDPFFLRSNPDLIEDSSIALDLSKSF